ncbi:hypothetical protein VP01_1964g1 [Puccinia sorghi]|uniref:Uncharacterized protein n=1 Tax=Puccinia sorghi TaxID=27349 RepID=A0A0L6VDQ1_9BASI|nr:hypothetical protein VP01_1964g1 [Puccinia sorghi]
MVFRRCNTTKIATVRILLQNHSQKVISNALGVMACRKSVSPWRNLYYEMKQVVYDHEKYTVQGQSSLLSAEDCEFMIEMVCTDPTVFLDEICECLYDGGGTPLGLTCIQENLINKPKITFKKPDTINICKNLAYFPSTKKMWPTIIDGLRKRLMYLQSFLYSQDNPPNNSSLMKIQNSSQSFLKSATIVFFLWQ